jgi:ATP-binding cassette subfamily F protein 3
MLLKPLNLLILDEPTNHLDLHSKDILLGCLKAFTGTVIFVSHDRGFMEALATKTLGLGSGRHRLYYGGYAYYLERTEADNEETVGDFSTKDLKTNVPQEYIVNEDQLNEDLLSNEDRLSKEETGIPSLEVSSNPKVILIKPFSQGDSMPASSLEHRAEKKQRQTLIRRLQREEAAILEELEKLEEEKSVLETQLSRPDVYSSAEKARQIKGKLDEITRALENKNAEWETKAAELAFTGN